MAKRGAKASGKTFFYPSEDVEAILDAIRERNEYGSLSRFVNEAIRQFAAARVTTTPVAPLRFVDPSPHYFDMADFLRESREVVMLGLTLSSIHRQDIFDLFKSKIIEQHTPLTFLLIDREVARTSGIFQTLSARYRDYERAHGGFLNYLDETYRLLRELVRLGSENRVSVRVRCLTSIPFCGLTISDPDRDSCQIRVALYLESRAGDVPPFYEVVPTTDEGRRATNAFMRHYHSLLIDASHDIPAMPDAG